jgi:hypothetical protein
MKFKEQQNVEDKNCGLMVDIFENLPALCVSALLFELTRFRLMRVIINVMATKSTRKRRIRYKSESEIYNGGGFDVNEAKFG